MLRHKVVTVIESRGGLNAAQNATLETGAATARPRLRSIWVISRKAAIQRALAHDVECCGQHSCFLVWAQGGGTRLVRRQPGVFDALLLAPFDHGLDFDTELLAQRRVRGLRTLY